MKIKIINKDFSICKLKDLSKIEFNYDFYFISKTDMRFY